MKSCGECRWCLKGQPAFCTAAFPRGSVRQIAQADIVIVNGKVVKSRYGDGCFAVAR